MRLAKCGLLRAFAQLAGHPLMKRLFAESNESNEKE
jgi:hypothetical protein